MFSLTHSPLPEWKNIFKIIIKKEFSDSELAKPWLQDRENGFWFSRSSWSFYIIAKFRKLVSKNKNINVWFPAYFCNTSLTLLRTLNVTISFYPLLGDGSPNLEVCNQMLGSEHPDLIVGVHYFGSPSTLVELGVFCKKNDAWFIEDCAHCLKYEEGIGNSGDFVLYSPHKFLPIPDGGLLIIRDEGPGKISKKLLDKFGFNDLYNLILNQGEKTSSITLIWLIKRCLQKIGIRSRKKLIKFQEDPTANDTKLFTNPNMSILAKKLLTFIHLKLEDEVILRKKNQAGWCKNLINKKIIVNSIAQPTGNYTPYLARFVANDSQTAEHIFDSLQKIGIPVSTWPDLPPEVLADENRYKISISMRKNFLLLPVHQSVNLARIESSVSLFF